MAQPDATNAHLHKLLSHRNYMHHVSLQKQLSIYEKQKKLVEKELHEITKVRQALQQIKRNFPKKSRKTKKRGDTRHESSKKSKSYESLLIKSGMTVKEKKEFTKQEVEVASLSNAEASNNGDQSKLFESRKKSKSHPSLLMKSEKILTETKEEYRLQEKVVEAAFVNGKETQTKINELNLFGPTDKTGLSTAIQSLPIQSKLYARRGVLPQQEPCKESSSEVTNKTNTDSITAASMDRLTREKLAEANVDPLSLNNGNMTGEGERRLRNQSTSNTGNKKLFTRGRPPYIKSSSAPSIPVQKPEEIVESEGKVTERCDIYQMTKAPTKIFNESRYSNSDGNLYKKALLENHLNEGTKLPVLSDQKHNDGQAGNTNKEENVLPAEKKRLFTLSPVSGTFSNMEFCFVQRSRPRPGTVCDLPTTKPKFAWSLPQAQEKFTKSTQIKSTFPNNDVCHVQPRARSKTVCTNYPPASYGRARSKTVSFHRGNQQRSEWPAKVDYGKNKSDSDESFRLSEDETIAIKGKFKQIGHSVLAIALMKKMTGNK